MCPNFEIFSSVFACTRIEYENLQKKSPYLVRIRENMDQKDSGLDTFHEVQVFQLQLH